MPQQVEAAPVQRWWVYPLEFFKNFTAFTAGYKQHNAALKWFRQLCESSKVETMRFSNEVPTEVPEIIHHKGVTFEWNAVERTTWSWMEMVAALDEASMEVVVKGADGRSGGLTGCSIESRRNSYDHKRAVQTKEHLPIWDFVLHRNDGTAIRVHPQWSTTKIETFGAIGHEHPVDPPRKGVGKSDGPGTFRRYKNEGNRHTLRFDAEKANRSSQSTAVAVAESTAVAVN